MFNNVRSQKTGLVLILTIVMLLGVVGATQGIRRMLAQPNDTLQVEVPIEATATANTTSEGDRPQSLASSQWLVIFGALCLLLAAFVYNLEIFTSGNY